MAASSARRNQRGGLIRKAHDKATNSTSAARRGQMATTGTLSWLGCVMTPTVMVISSTATPTK